MNPPPRRRLGWKVFWALLTAIAAVVAGFALWIHFLAEAKWQAMIRDVAKIREEVAAQRQARRPDIAGDPLPGNSWEDYRQARRSLDQTSLARRGKLPPEIPAKLLETAQNAAGEGLDRWKTGTRRQVAFFDWDWEGDQDLYQDWRTTEIWLLELPTARARHLIKEGRLSDAAEWLLGVLRFTVDVTENTPFPSRNWRDQWSMGIRELLSEQNIPRDVLDRLERGLEAAEGHFQQNEACILHSAEQLGAWLIREDPYYLMVSIGEYKVPIKPSWRHAWSMKLFKADAFLKFEYAARRVIELRRAGGPITDPDLAFLRRDWDNRILRGFIEMLDESNGEELAPTMRLRLLRVAAHYRATGEVLELDDPYGGKLSHSLSGQGLKVWSRGSDRTSNQGVGDWVDREGKDVVLEVPR